jgi:hypothetical protein
VSYELHSDDWKKRVAETHVKNRKGYGQRRGHIGLQDYSDHLWFRNIQIRPLEKD